MGTVPHPGVAPWLLDAGWLLLRASAILALAWMGIAAMRGASAAARHRVLRNALAAVLVLPLLSLLVPSWEVGLLAFPVPAAGGTPSPAGAAGAAGWGTLLAAAWAVGVLAVAGRYALAVLAARAAARDATEVTDPAWLGLLRATSDELGVRARVRLLRAAGAAMPMTWGVFAPVVLLPACSAAWPDERRRVVLLHELAHVARRDCLWQGVASICCALLWFHPGAWWAAVRMRAERERAADDRVLAVGTRASDYAGHLVAVARASRPGALTPVVAALGRGSQLEERVVAVLDGSRRRGAAEGRGAALATVLAAAVLLPLAAVRPWPPSPDDDGIVVLPARIAAPPAPSAAEPALAVAPPVPRVEASLPRPAPRRRVGRAAVPVGEPEDATIPSAASAPPAAGPTAARAASAPVDPALRILGGLAEDTTYLYQPATAAEPAGT
jgi:beta-lactamase regulating signal transducer with metallopeptidase domain